jgi:hypothetical protein
MSDTTITAAPAVASAEELQAQLDAEKAARVAAEAKAAENEEARRKAEAAIVVAKNKADALRRQREIEDDDEPAEALIDEKVKAAIEIHKHTLVEETVEETARTMFPDDSTRRAVLEKYKTMPKSGMTAAAIQKDLDDIHFLLNRPAYEAALSETKVATERTAVPSASSISSVPVRATTNELTADEEREVAQIARFAKVSIEDARARFIKNKAG